MSAPEFTDADMDALNYRLNNPTHAEPLDDEPGPWDRLLTVAANTILIGACALGLFIIGVQIEILVTP